MQSANLCVVSQSHETDLGKSFFFSLCCACQHIKMPSPALGSRLVLSYSTCLMCSCVWLKMCLCTWFLHMYAKQKASDSDLSMECFSHVCVAVWWNGYLDNVIHNFDVYCIAVFTRWCRAEGLLKTLWLVLRWEPAAVWKSGISFAWLPFFFVDKYTHTHTRFHPSTVWKSFSNEDNCPLCTGHILYFRTGKRKME